MALLRRAPVLPLLVPALERHGALTLAPALRKQLLRSHVEENARGAHVPPLRADVVRALFR